MAKLTLDNIGNFTSGTVTTINTNFDRIEAALEKTLSRDGTVPNQMEADLDINNNDILNAKDIHADTIVADNLVVEGFDFENIIADMTEIKEDAEESADRAEAAAALAQAGAGAPVFSTKVLAEAYSPAVAPDYIQTAGYTTPGDGGKALYKKVLVEPTHDGKFSITLSDTVTVVWYELAEKTINPFMFGAVGDGVVDDSAALNSIATAMSGDFFKSLHIPGHFLHNSPTGFVIAGVTGVSIVGDGRDVSSLIAGDLSGARPFIVNNVDGCYVSGIEFLSLNSNNVANNFELQNVNDATVEKCRFKDATHYGLGVFEDTLGGPAGTCNNLVIRDNEFINNGIFGIEPFPKVKSNHCEIYGNYFEHVGFNQLAIPAQDPACMKPVQGYETALVHNNVLYDCGNGGIWFGMGDHYEVRDNQIWDCKGLALAMTIIEHILFPPGEITFQNAIVKGNTVGYSPGFVNTADSVSIAATNILNGHVLIADNTIIGGVSTNSMIVQTTVAVPNLVFENNTFINPPANSISLTNVAGAAPNAPIIRGNKIYNTNMAETAVGRITLTGVANPSILENYFQDVGNQAITTSACTGRIEIEGNIIDGYNVANTASVAAINITDAVANTYVIRRNTLRTGNGNPKALMNVGTTPSIIMDNNIVPPTVPIVLSGTPTIVVDSTIPWTNYGRARWFYGTAAPVAGAHGVGDLVWNTSPVASGTIGWICTLGGTPGTWKTFGTISA